MGATIRGAFVGKDETPLAGYRLRVTDAAGNVYESPPAGPQGEYVLSDLPAGLYTYEILDLSGNVVSMSMPPVELKVGMTVTQRFVIAAPKNCIAT